MAKKVIAAVVGVCLLIPANAGARQSPPQEESGTVAYPSPHPQATDECFAGIARRTWMVTNGASDTPFNQIFDVDKTTWGGKFTLDGEGPSGQEDLDIFFYADFGPGVPDDPTMNAPVEVGRYQERAVGGEKGKVAKGATKAVVCLYAGAAASYTYKATPPKKKKK